MWLDKLNQKGHLEKEEIENIERTYKEFTMDMRLNQASKIKNARKN